MASRERKALRAFLVRRGWQESPVHKVLKVLKARRAFPARKARLVHRDFKVLWDPRALRERKVFLARRVL